MTEQYPSGFIASFPTGPLCRCGDGTPHYHSECKVWDGNQWHVEGTEGWDRVRLGYVKEHGAKMRQIRETRKP